MWRGPVSCSVAGTRELHASLTPKRHFLSQLWRPLTNHSENDLDSPKQVFHRTVTILKVPRFSRSHVHVAHFTRRISPFAFFCNWQRRTQEFNQIVPPSLWRLQTVTAKRGQKGLRERLGKSSWLQFSGGGAPVPPPGLLP